MKRALLSSLLNCAAVTTFALAMSGAAETTPDASAAFATPVAPTTVGSGAGIKPFLASYSVTWRGMNAGNSDFELKRQPDGRYLYTSRSNASGLFKLIASHEIVQTSLFELTSAGVKPLQYRGDDGSKSTERDISLDFDWAGGRIRGTAENQKVDIALPPGTQDALSIQIAAIHDLQNGRKPADCTMVDKDTVKEYHYTYEGTARIQTALGELDTVVYRSQRVGSSKRTTRTWQAPSLGFIPVRAERLKDGKREMLLEISKLQQ